MNKRNSNTLGGTFIIELFKTLNWLHNESNADFIVEECSSEKTMFHQSVTCCKRVLSLYAAIS